MTFEIKKGYGMQTANYLRQLLLTRVPTWRPIAFSVGNNSNVVTAGDNVLEDTVEISTNLCRYHYDIDSDEDLYKLTLSDKCININNLNTDKVTVLDADSSEIIHALNQNITLTIYFRRDSGIVFVEQNQAYLQRDGINADNKIIMNSRHCNFENVIINVTEKDDVTEIVSINIDASYDIDVYKIVKICCSEAINMFETIMKSVL